MKTGVVTMSLASLGPAKDLPGSTDNMLTTDGRRHRCTHTHTHIHTHNDNIHDHFSEIQKASKWWFLALGIPTWGFATIQDHRRQAASRELGKKPRNIRQGLPWGVGKKNMRWR